MPDPATIVGGFALSWIDSTAEGDVAAAGKIALQNKIPQEKAVDYTIGI